MFGPDITAEDQPEADPSSGFVGEFTGIGRDPAEVERLEREKRAEADFEFLGGDFDRPDLMDEDFNALEMEIDSLVKSNEIGTPAYSLAGSPYETEGRRQEGTKTKDMPLKTRKRTKRTERTDQSDPFKIPRRGDRWKIHHLYLDRLELMTF